MATKHLRALWSAVIHGLLWRGTGAGVGDGGDASASALAWEVTSLPGVASHARMPVFLVRDESAFDAAAFRARSGGVNLRLSAGGAPVGAVCATIEAGAAFVAAQPPPGDGEESAARHLTQANRSDDNRSRGLAAEAAGGETHVLVLKLATSGSTWCVRSERRSRSLSRLSLWRRALALFSLWLAPGRLARVTPGDDHSPKRADSGRTTLLRRAGSRQVRRHPRWPAVGARQIRAHQG